MVKVGDEIEVKVLRVDAKDRKIGLSMQNVDDGKVPDEIPDMPIEGEEAETGDGGEGRSRGKDEGQGEGQGKEAEKAKLRGGTGTAGPLFTLPGRQGMSRPSSETNARPREYPWAFSFGDCFGILPSSFGLSVPDERNLNQRSVRKILEISAELFDSRATKGVWGLRPEMQPEILLRSKN